MMKAATVPPAYADAAIAAADALEAHATELLELARVLRDELEFAGEVQANVVKRLERLIEDQQTSLAALVEASQGADAK